jgi:hypothetical protein
LDATTHDRLASFVKFAKSFRVSRDVSSRIWICERLVVAGHPQTRISVCTRSGLDPRTILILADLTLTNR